MSHDQTETMTMGDGIVVMGRNRQQVDSPSEITIRQTMFSSRDSSERPDELLPNGSSRSQPENGDLRRAGAINLLPRNKTGYSSRTSGKKSHGLRPEHVGRLPPRHSTTHRPFQQLSKSSSQWVRNLSLHEGWLGGIRRVSIRIANAPWRRQVDLA